MNKEVVLCGFCNGTISFDENDKSIIHSIPLCPQFTKLITELLEMDSKLKPIDTEDTK